MSTSAPEAAISSLIASQSETYTKVSVKAVGSQLVIMIVVSCATVLGFSFFRPRQNKVYAPKIKYQLPEPANPVDDPDYEPPPPPISNGFFAWFSPVIRIKEEQMIANIGLDAATFLRFLRLLRHIFTVISLLGIVLLVLNVIYNVKYVASDDRNALSLLTIQDVKGGWMWPALGASYLINFVVMYFTWRNWTAMLFLRNRWFRSPAYQTKIYSRTLMVTQVRKDFRSDEGLVHLMGLLKVDGIKIGPEIDCTSIGRRLGDFPELVEDHNKAVADLESHLVKYLKGGKLGKKRPTMRKGGFMGMGGNKVDAIDYLAKEIKFLRDRIDAERQAIDSLLRQERKARKGGKPVARVEGENYGFVTFKTIAEAHRIARAHQGRLKELFGARLHLAPMPQDIVWQNISKEPAEISSRQSFGFVLIGIVCFFNTVPLLVVSLLANLTSLTVWVPFLEDWKNAGKWGNWTFSIVSGVLPSIVSFLFGYFLPIILRSISRYQGAPTRSRLDRAVTARYFFFVILSNLIVFTLLGVFYNAITTVVLEIGQHQSASEVLKGLEQIPDKIQGTYVQQSTYWLTWLPLRGFLVIFELIQLIKLAMVSLRRVMFSHTPRVIREMTKPEYFEYAVVIVNLLFVAAVGMIYAPLAPLVAIGACCVFWFSSVVYKYQLLYVYVSRAESGGRMWNVYINRLIACAVLMQLLMVLTTGLIRQRWLDSIAAVPPLIIMAAFKIWIDKTVGTRFRYYEPTPQEAEAERQASMSEKRTRHSEMEKRFLHPALQQDKLFTIMVHKQQEALARDVLSSYPWFAGKHQHDGVQINAVREENLEYDPQRDGPRDEEHQAEWDARSIGSTPMLGGKSEFSTMSSTPVGDEGYNLYPLPIMETLETMDTPPNAFNSNVNLPINNPSTDQLLDGPERSDTYRERAYGLGLGLGRGGRQNSSGLGLGRPFSSRRANASDDNVAGAPLLDFAQEPQTGGNVPYPPSAYTQPPHGYTPPTIRRTATDRSDDVDDVGSTKWDDGSDMGETRYRQSRQGSRDADAAAYYQPSRQGSRDAGAAPIYQPPRQGSRDAGSGLGLGQDNIEAFGGHRGYGDPYAGYERRSGY